MITQKAMQWLSNVPDAELVTDLEVRMELVTDRQLRDVINRTQPRDIWDILHGLTDVIDDEECKAKLNGYKSAAELERVRKEVQELMDGLNRTV